MATLTQANRPLRLETPLGADALLLERFTGQEGVSMPFRFTLDMISEDPAIDPEDLLRQPVCVTIALPGEGERIIHGRINRFAQRGRRDGIVTEYRAEMVPWLWFLSLTRDCRIFQDESVTDIADKLFKEAGFNDFQIKPLKPLPKREYCVQYRESTFDFVSRLFEDEGLFYFFVHSEKAHELVVTDHTGQLPDCPEVSKMRMAAAESWAMAKEPVVTTFEQELSAITGKVTLTDYNFEHPSRGLLASVAGGEPNEVYDYPGGHGEKPDGERYARLRLEQSESMRHVVRGTSNCASLTSGHKFELTDHPFRKANRAYHVLRVRHDAAIGNYTTSAGNPFDYANAFEAIPDSVPYRPALVTPRALIRGTQTAEVVGKKGEEIWVDKFGRVKVQFHWDRVGRKDENSSCWVRVSSAWAGKGWGSIQIPRIGQEVIVDFLEGNPDQPIIVGRVYNGEMMPPYGLPDGGVVSGGKSQTHKGKGYNEISMDDTAKKEKITIHAQYDMSTTVEHDDTQTVKNDRTITVDGKHTEKIKKDTSIEVTDGNLTQKVSKGTASFTVKKDIDVKSETTFVHITADTEIQLKVGASKLLMKKSGEIELSGKNIAIKGTESVDTSGLTVTAKADTLHKIEGANVLVDGKATATVKGGMVMLNP